MSDFNGPLAWKPHSYPAIQDERPTHQTYSLQSTTSSSTVYTHGHFGPADMASPPFTAPSPGVYGEDMGHLDAPSMFLPPDTNRDLAGFGEFAQDLPQPHRELRPAPDRNCQRSGGAHGAQRHRNTGVHRRTTSIKALTRF